VCPAGLERIRRGNDAEVEAYGGRGQRQNQQPRDADLRPLMRPLDLLVGVVGLGYAVISGTGGPTPRRD